MVLHTENGVLYAGPHRVLKGWESFSGWYWFGVEKINEDDTWFGYVQGIEEEWGYFSEAEIKSLGNLAWKIPQKNLPFSGRRTKS